MANFLSGLYQFIINKNIPGQLVIQITDRCNASCPQCGMRVSEPFSRTSLSEEKIIHMLDSAKEKEFQAVSFTGGEPFLDFKRLIRLIEHASRLNIPYIRTGTNGFIFKNSDAPGYLKKIETIAKSLKATNLRNLWISIDSAIPSVHEEMRGFEGVIEGIRKALPVFHEHGIYPSANLGINRNINGPETRELLRSDFDSEETYLNVFFNKYQAAFRRFYHFVSDMGFTMVNTCYPMSIDESDLKKGLNPVYAASAIDNIIKFDRNEKIALYQALLSVIPSFRSKIRIFSPLCSLYALKQQYAAPDYKPYPCRGGIDFFFASSKEGGIYPCGYRGNEKLPDVSLLDHTHRKSRKECISCDWECFRDPSELFGPVLQMRSDFFGLFRKIFKDPVFFKLWMEDLSYYRACQLFSGRKSVDLKKLSKFNDPPVMTFDTFSVGLT